MKKSSLCILSLSMALTVMGQPGGQNQLKAYMVADAHLDTQWNWDVQTTIKDYIWKTMTQNFHLLKTYPDYIFNFEGGVKYWWMKEYYPLEYEQVKKYVAQGRWHLAGSSWDANETVICSAESWIRNILLGQTFYRQEFGKEGTDVFLPDCFGFGYDLPTLASHCGLIGFSSQKLGWRYNAFYPGGKKYPFPVGLWQGIDGSRIMMTHGFSYGQRFKDEDLSNSSLLKSELGESTLGTIYRYYGTGDTGGSPTVESVRAVEKGIHGNGPIKIISATSDQIYKDYLPFDKHPELPVADGEMTMDVHGTGCYTSQAAMKLYNRQNEHLGDAAERASVIAEYLGLKPYPISEMTDNWRRMIWNQFHDDLPGTCIPKAYEFAWNDELLTLNRFSNVLTSAVGGVASQLNTMGNGTPIILYNNESFPVSAVANLRIGSNAGEYTVTDASGRKVVSQVVNGAKGEHRLLFDAKVQGTGFAVYHVKAGKAKYVRQAKDGNVIENSVYKLTVDGNGDISSLIDKRSNRQLVAQDKTLGLVVFKDCESYTWPAWEILKKTLDKEPEAIKGNVSVKVVEDGPLCKTLRIDRTFGKSAITQYVSLYEGSQAERIDIRNDVNWQEPDAMLKANFPLTVSNPKATYDIGLGSVQRGNNTPQAYEVYSHEWTDLTDTSGQYGVTVLNDSKYGWDKPNDNTIRLSLLFSPKVKNNYVYQANQDFGHHTFTYSIIGHEGALDKSKAVEQATILNSPLRAFSTTSHKGQLGKEYSFLSSDNPNVTVHALKKAEVSDEYVVRVYENTGSSQQTAHIKFGGNIVKAVEADGTEKTTGEASFDGNTLNVTIRPYSVKTYKVILDNRQLASVPSEQIALPFDTRCFSSKDFPSSANFSGGYSYAAELLPDDGLTVDGVHFSFGDKDGDNGMSCKGQTIKINPKAGYTKVYILAASKKGDRKATFSVGRVSQTFTVCDYHQFVGQWGHDGQTRGYMKDAEVAYIGTHRHSTKGDDPYEFTYMFKYALDVPKGASSITFPQDDNIVVFAATASNVSGQPDVVAAAPLFRTNNKTDEAADIENSKANLLAQAKVIDRSGQVNANEKAENLVDGNEETKWCDTSDAPNYVTFDLGSSKTISGWKMVNAGIEDASMITRSCILQGRNSLTEDWKTIDLLDGNSQDVVARLVKPVSYRYIRLFVVSPTQGTDHDAARIYELSVF